MPASPSPADLVPELARLTASLKGTEILLDLLAGRLRLDRWYGESEDPEDKAEQARLSRERDEVQAALEALLAEFRVETPAEAAACAEALASVPSGAAAALAMKLLARPSVDAALVVPALEKALSDEDRRVRAEAWEGIVAAFDLKLSLRNTEAAYDVPTEVALWRAFLECHRPAFVEIGVAGMRGLIRPLQAGASRESLGLAWKPDRAGGLIQRLHSALPDPTVALPVGEVAQLTGADRYLAEAMIAASLELVDGRAPVALARLGAKWTVPLLRAIVASDLSRSSFREEFAQSLRTLEDAGQTPPLPSPDQDHR